jgi:hypothetical protein
MPALTLCAAACAPHEIDIRFSGLRHFDTTDQFGVGGFSVNIVYLGLNQHREC